MMNAGTAEFENLQTDIGVLTALISLRYSSENYS